MTILQKLAAPALASFIALGAMVSTVHAAPTHQVSFSDRGDRGDRGGDKGDKDDKGDKGDKGDKDGGRDGGH